MSNDTVFFSETSESGIKMPSYSFAKRHGILVKQSSENKIEILFQQKTSIQALFEMRRLIDRSVTFVQISEESFDVLLQEVYEQKSGHAQQMVDDMQDNIDLSYMAQHLPKPEDLLESADEAPIIRLINALLTEAIKENASDIHIESYEKRMVVRFRIKAPGQAGKPVESQANRHG